MTQQPSLPFRGRSATALACSMRGAEYAARYRAQKTFTVLRLIRESRAKGLTDHDLVRLTGYERSTICSTRNALVDAELVADSQRARTSGRFGRDCTVWVAV